MRVTQSMLTNNMLRNLSQSYGRLEKYQEQLATGKKISRPSDDPVVAMKGMFYRTNLTEVEQYKRNLGEIYNWMDNSDAGLEQANSALQRTRELLLQANNDTYGPDDRKAIAKEIQQLKEDLASVANTQVAGKYIFNGTDIDKKPVDFDADGKVVVDNNTADVEIEISPGVKLNVNVNPENVFNQELFSLMENIEQNLEMDNHELLTGNLSDLDKHIDQLTAERTEVGARYNRLELIESRISQQEVITTRIMSDNEDADLERVITEMKSQESIHRAALSVGGRIIQPTLVDFLR